MKRQCKRWKSPSRPSRRMEEMSEKAVRGQLWHVGSMRKLIKQIIAYFIVCLLHLFSWFLNRMGVRRKLWLSALRAWQGTSNQDCNAYLIVWFSRYGMIDAEGFSMFFATSNELEGSDSEQYETCGHARHQHCPEDQAAFWWKPQAVRPQLTVSSVELGRFKLGL